MLGFTLHQHAIKLKENAIESLYAGVEIKEITL